jgi:hypothetical protein
LQTEREKAQAHLFVLKKQLNELQKIMVTAQARITLGSLVSTSLGTFYIAIPIGKLTINDKEIFIISLQSPIGLKMLGLTSGDYFELNGNKISVSSVQ